MGNKVSRVIIGLLVIVGCDKAEQVTGPMWPPPKPIKPITLTPDFIGADAIAGFEARFFPYAGFSIKNTGTAKRWAYAYITPIDSQQTVGSKYLLVNPGATWSASFNATCVQLDLSTQAVSGRPDIGFQFYDKRGNIMTAATRTTAINECRAASQCISDRTNPNWNCQECSDAGVCLVPR